MSRTDRERDVLRLWRDDPGAMLAPAAIARMLNFYLRRVGTDRPQVVRRSCAWCPVGEKLPGQQCRSIPRRSYRRVLGVLRSLVAQGRLHRYAERHRSWYHLPGALDR